MKKTLAEIAELVGGRVVGKKDLIIRGLNGIQEAKEGDLTFLSNSKYITRANKTKASAILVPPDLAILGKPLIQTKNPSMAFAQVAAAFLKKPPLAVREIHATAVVAKDVVLGDDVAIGPYVVIESGAMIDSGTTILAGSFVGSQTKIGNRCVIYQNVTIRENVTLGNRVSIHSGTVIGSDGFGYEQIEGQHVKIPQWGTVVIEDDVEIGANVTVDRARFDRTLIGKGTKIDNLVQIAHNVQIGENCIVISQVGISGSVTVERGSILAGQVGVVGHVTIGEGSVVAARAVVTKSLPAHSKVFGFPAKPIDHAKKVNAALQKLPQYIKLIGELQKKIDALQKRIDE